MMKGLLLYSFSIGVNVNRIYKMIFILTSSMLICFFLISRNMVQPGWHIELITRNEHLALKRCLEYLGMVGNGFVTQNLS